VAGTTPSIITQEYVVYKPYEDELIDSNVVSRAEADWVSDKMYEVLNYISQFIVVKPYDLVIAGYCKDPKVAYVYVRRLVVKGVLQRVGRGIYRVVHEVIQKLLRLPVRKLSNGRRVRNSKQVVSDSVVRFSKWTRGLNGNLSGGLGGGLVGVGGSVGGGGCVGGGLGYVGLFFDNVRWFGGDGCLHQLGRDELLSYGSLPDDVRYFEVTHVVSGDVLDGVVVIYTNVEDFDRFKKPSTRVNWLPPSGFVRHNGVAPTVHYAKHEFIKAFKFLAVVLKEELPVRELNKLFSWLSWTWFRTKLSERPQPVLTGVVNG
jgi:hypothetical protein